MVAPAMQLVRVSYRHAGLISGASGRLTHQRARNPEATGYFRTRASDMVAAAMQYDPAPGWCHSGWSASFVLGAGSRCQQAERQ